MGPHAHGGSEGQAPAARWALAALSLAALLASLGTSAANVALPTLAGTFSASFRDVQWVVLAYLVAVTTAVVGVGRLGDVIGRRRVLLGGIALFTASSAASAVAPALWLLIAARAAQGAGAAAMLSLTLALVAEAVPAARTGRAMGLLATMSALGTALGPTLGGALIAGLGWRSIFLVLALLGILALVLAGHALPADRPRGTQARGRFDWTGTLLLGGALMAYTLAVTLGGGSFGISNAALLTAAIAGSALFVLAQARAPSPLIPPALVRDRAIVAGLTTNALVSTVMMATLVVGPFYLARSLALQAALVGLALSTGPIVTALTGIPAGRLSDRFGSGPVTLAGLTGMAAGAGGLALLPAPLGVTGYLLPIVVLTAGYSLFQTSNTTAVMRAVAPGQRGVVSGTLNLSRNLGLVTGASVMGDVFALATGPRGVTAAAPAAVATGMRVTYAVAAALILVALVIAARSRAAGATTWPTIRWFGDRQRRSTANRTSDLTP
jgi:MFS family permease